MNTTIRPAVVADVPDIVRVCNQAWKGIWQGDPQMFVNRITTFPDGGVVVAVVDGTIEGYVSVQITTEDVIFRPTWNEATDSGHIIRTHNPNGDWIHGLGLAITPKGSNSKVARRLILHLHEYILSNNIRGGAFLN